MSTASTNVSVFRLWLRVRQLPLVAAVFGGIAVVGVIGGSEVVPLPPLGGFGGAVGLTWFAPVAAACAIAIPLNSPFEEREASAAVRSRLHSAAVTTVLTGVGALMVGVIALVENATHPPSQLVAGLLYWVALALVSARVFGPSLAWALPVTAVVPVAAFGIGIGHGTAFLWWALPVSPGTATAIATGAGMYAAALGFWSLSPHRLRRLGWRW